VDSIGLVSCFDSFGLCGFRVKERGRTLRAESGADTSAHRQGWGRGWPGERDRARHRATGCFCSGFASRCEDGDGLAGLHCFSWAASSQLGRAGVGDGNGWLGRTRFPAGFRPTAKIELKIPFLFSKSVYNLQTNLNSIQV
jgi:hypothetical protein